MKTPHIIIQVSGGVVTGVLAQGAVHVTLVDWDSITESHRKPELPDGVQYGEREKNLIFNDSNWSYVY